MIVLVEPLFFVSFQRDYNFIDRKDIFSQIEKQLQMHHYVSLCEMKGIEYRFFPLNKILQTLTEGVRKSQIAIEYAYYAPPPISPPRPFRLSSEITQGGK